jgi:IMP dehydrogenase
MIAPSLQTEGKQLQSSQGVGMGSRGAAAEVNMPSDDTESLAPSAAAVLA